MHDNLSKFIDCHNKRDGDRSETPIFPQDVYVTKSVSVASQPIWGVIRLFSRDKRAMPRLVSPNWSICSLKSIGPIQGVGTTLPMTTFVQLTVST